MNRKLSRFMTTVTGIGVAMLMSTAAWATPPATVVGTWTLLVDQTLSHARHHLQGGPGTACAA